MTVKNKETTAIELSQLNKEILKISQQKRVSSKVNEIAMHLLAAVFQIAYRYENPNYFLKAKYHNPLLKNVVSDSQASFLFVPHFYIRRKR